MFKIFTAVLAATAVLPFLVLAQDEPIYVPFEWSQVPLTATVIGVSGGATSYALIDGPGGGFVAPGPATLIQGPSGASMLYVNNAAASPTTLSGICNLMSPVAVCTLNVQVTGAPLPGTGPSAPVGTNTKKSSTGSTSHSNSGNGAASLGSRPTGTIIAMSSIALGFCIALALLR